MAKRDDEKTTAGDEKAAAAGDNQPDQSNENPEALEADPHVYVPGENKAMSGPSQDDLNPAFAPPPAPDAKDGDDKE